MFPGCGRFAASRSSLGPFSLRMHRCSWGIMLIQAHITGVEDPDTAETFAGVATLFDQDGLGELRVPAEPERSLCGDPQKTPLWGALRDQRVLGDSPVLAG